MASAAGLQDLPLDILLSIIPYLSPIELLSLCATCCLFQKSEELRLSPIYWGNITKRTFRIPNRLALEADGRKWSRLYRRMLTHTRVFRWGKEANSQSHSFTGRTRNRLGITNVYTQSSGWPVETDLSSTVHIGVVADIQCGGWSTTVLNSSGALFTIGIIDGSPRQHPRATPAHRTRAPEFEALAYPAGYPAPNERHCPSTAITQFSAGRGHILGLSDSGKIWTWESVKLPGRHVKFVSVDLLEGQSKAICEKNGYVTQVVAGWNCSSAYINGTGIIIWEPSISAEVQAQADLSAADGMMVLESWTVPWSQYRRKHEPTYSPADLDLSYLAENVGELTNYVVLEAFVIFITDIGKVFVTKHKERQDNEHLVTLEIVRPTLNLGSLKEPQHYVVDIYGAFHRFGLIKRNGEVLVDSADFISSYWNRKIQTHQHGSQFDETSYVDELFKRYPCLQHTGVIAMAFGDWHYHALHADGTISSYGHEPEYSGSLGLGNENRSDNTRGVFNIGLEDGKIHESCYNRLGRKIYFEGEKKLWFNQIRLAMSDPNEAEARRSATASRPELSVHVSEWFEEKLSGWEQGPNNLGHSYAPPAIETLTEDDDDELPAYFALSVAAAGWRSAALVLVNDAKADRIRQKYIRPAEVHTQDGTDVIDGKYGHRSLDLPKGLEWVWADDTFPRLKLPGGEIMPGTAPIIDRSHVTDLYFASNQSRRE